ncbi:MAG TPA: hypothetical protein VK603_04055, partial [Candidatus Saccharimonadales bacterium]|nr:hypothetical protein [Candidatus Saccharimonadales bacterium]
TMVLKRDLMIIYEAATTGTSTAQIIDQQNASSGMWAFREGLEVLFLVVLFYLLWPICFNAVGRLPRLWAFAKKAQRSGYANPLGRRRPHGTGCARFTAAPRRYTAEMRRVLAMLSSGLASSQNENDRHRQKLNHLHPMPFFSFSQPR